MRKGWMLWALGAIGLLGGCTAISSQISEPSGEPPSQGSIYNGWISKHQDEIAQKALTFIRQRHPEIDPAFPNIDIRNVIVNGGPASDQEEIRGVLQSLTGAILGARPGVPTWEADVTVNFHEHQPSKGLIAAIAVPELAVCLGTIYVVCPVRHTEEVQMYVDVATPDGRHAQFAVAGYGELYESTAMLEDNDKEYAKNITERNTAGLVAAIVGAADKLVDTYKNLDPTASASHR